MSSTSFQKKTLIMDPPPENCSICLRPIGHASFSDGCFHNSCFTCLVLWSNVKPECPLCHKPFKSILHNIQSDYSCNKFHVDSRTTDQWNCGAINPRAQNSRNITPSNFMQRNGQDNSSINSSIESYRLRFDPHVVRFNHNARLMPYAPCPSRSRVYSRGLWVQPIHIVVPGHKPLPKSIKPSFFQKCPEIHKSLLPWLNRELYALIGNNPNRVSFLLELIMDMITRYRISSKEFFSVIEPYLADKTHHFVHEFLHYSLVPLILECYDKLSRYGSSKDIRIQFDAEGNIRMIDFISHRNSTAAQTSGNVQKTQNNQSLMPLSIPIDLLDLSYWPKSELRT